MTAPDATGCDPTALPISTLGDRCDDLPEGPGVHDEGHRESVSGIALRQPSEEIFTYLCTPESQVSRLIVKERQVFAV